MNEFVEFIGTINPMHVIIFVIGITVFSILFTTVCNAARGESSFVIPILGAVVIIVCLVIGALYMGEERKESDIEYIKRNEIQCYMDGQEVDIENFDTSEYKVTLNEDRTKGYLTKKSHESGDSGLSHLFFWMYMMK